MKRLRILVPTFGFSGPKAFTSILETCRMVHVNKTKFLPKAGDFILNWGCAKVPNYWELNIDVDQPHWLNSPMYVAQSGNRLKSLPIMKEAGVNVPEFTSEFDVAAGWLADGSGVIARASIRSHAGQGLTYIGPGGELQPGMAMYVKYRPKRDEYRVHVFCGQVIDVQQKRRRKDFDGMPVDPKIRSHDRGWVFCRQGVTVPPVVVSAATLAVASLKLDFGGVDVGYDVKNDRATVYEVNTAPGLKGTTTLKYAEAIKEWYAK